MIKRFHVWKWTRGPGTYGPPVWKLVAIVTGRTEAEAEQAARQLRDKVEDRQRRLHGRFKAPVPCITLGEVPRYLTEPLPGTKEQYRLKRRTMLQLADTAPNGRTRQTVALPEGVQR
jgi:hypothetical protein